MEYDNYDIDGGDLDAETTDLINNRVNTRKVYLSQINQLTDWITRNKPELYDGALKRLSLPLNNTAILSYATALSGRVCTATRASAFIGGPSMASISFLDHTLGNFADLMQK